MSRTWQVQRWRQRMRWGGTALLAAGMGLLALAAWLASLDGFGLRAAGLTLVAAGGLVLGAMLLRHGSASAPPGHPELRDLADTGEGDR